MSVRANTGSYTISSRAQAKVVKLKTRYVRGRSHITLSGEGCFQMTLSGEGCFQMIGGGRIGC